VPPTPLQIYRARLAEVLASVAQGQRDLQSIHAQVSAEIIEQIHRAGDNTNAVELARQFDDAFKKTAFKRLSITKTLVESGAKAGPKAGRATIRATFGDATTKAQVRATKRALTEASERISGRVTVDGVALGKRIRSVDKDVAADLAREVQAGIQQRKGILGAARKIERIDPRESKLPKYLAEIEHAARTGNVADVKRLSKQYVKRIAALGEIQVDGTIAASKYSLRKATARFVQDVQKASASGVDKLVKKYVTERAAWRANVIARHETVSAFRQSYIEQTKYKPGVVAFRWQLSTRHATHGKHGGTPQDECDLYAVQNAHGMGPGVYPKDQVPDAPHPLCLCSTVAVMDRKHFERAANDQGAFPADMRDATSPDAPAWLRANPDQAAAILGPTRHSLFKQGVNVLDETGKPRLVRELVSRFSRAAE
jgi:hypothetical protein